VAKMDSDSDYLTDDVESSQQVAGARPPTQPTKGFGERHLLELKSSLGLDSFAEKKAQKSAKRKRQKERRKLAKEQAASSLTTSKVIETAATRKDQSLAQQPEVVEYKDPRKSRKKTEAVQESQPNASSANDPDKQEVSMREARFDVFKFGVKGFDKEGQMSAREALAVRLGAKPAKNKGMPYKEYKAKMREERAKEAEAKQEKKHQLMTSARSTVSINPMKRKGQQNSAKKDNKLGKNSKKRKSGGGGKGGLQPQMGRFDGGMLKLSAKEIAAMKSKK